MNPTFILIAKIFVGIMVGGMILAVIQSLREELKSKRDVYKAIRSRKRTFKLTKEQDERLEVIKKAEPFNGEVERWED
jgi:predicted Holliday junction resolvase-like endonuclease